MPLETATYVSDLVTANPAGSDPLAKSADHLRLLKAVLKNTLGTLSGPLINASGAIAIPGNGTSSAPAIGFTSEPTLGLYRVGAGEIGITGRVVGQGTVPIGALIDYAGTIAPPGLLACNGQAVSRTTYAELYLAIGTIWGAGDGSTTFNVPNLIDRYRRHAGGSHGGSVGTLQDPDVVPHVHQVYGTTDTENTGHTHSFSGNTGSMNQNTTHSHTYTGFSANYPGYGAGSGVGGGGSFGFGTNGTTNTVNLDHLHSFAGTTSGEQQNHAHSMNFNSGSTGGSETRPYSASVLTCIRAL